MLAFESEKIPRERKCRFSKNEGSLNVEEELSRERSCFASDNVLIFQSASEMRAKINLVHAPSTLKGISQVFRISTV